MSRAKIGAVVVFVVAALTAAAYVLTTKRLEGQIRKDVESRVARAQRVVLRTAVVEALEMDARVGAAALDTRFIDALETDPAKTTPEKRNAAFHQAIADFNKVQDKTKAAKPDFIALTDKDGWVVFMDVQLTERENWKTYKAVSDALDFGEVSRDIWDYHNAVQKVGVAPIAGKGALVLGYALNATQARQQADLLGMDVAYFFDNRVRATSFRGGGAAADLAALTKVLVDKGLGDVSVDLSKNPMVRTSLNGETYVATAAPLPYENKTTGAMVMLSESRSLESIGVVKVTIWLLGAGAILIALLAMLITARLILSPAEEIELGVTEIINGNVDYTFKPAGADFDGLANALNVMLARLTGRPEPGDEGLDDAPAGVGNKVALDDDRTGPQATADPEIAALAHEPEADYYKRLYGEYLAARKQTGESTEGVTFESFVAKLRLNEGALKKKHNCKMVRFRVTTKNGQVTLKPVPIM